MRARDRERVKERREHGSLIFIFGSLTSAAQTLTRSLSQPVRALLYLPSFSQADIHHRVVLRARLARLLDPGSKRIDSLLESNKGNVLCKKRPQEREREKHPPKTNERETKRAGEEAEHSCLHPELLSCTSSRSPAECKSTSFGRLWHCAPSSANDRARRDSQETCEIEHNLYGLCFDKAHIDQ